MPFAEFRALLRDLIQSPNGNPKARFAVLNFLRTVANEQQPDNYTYTKRFRTLGEEAMKAYIEVTLLRHNHNASLTEVSREAEKILSKSNSRSTTSLPSEKRTREEDKWVELSRQYWYRLLHKAGLTGNLRDGVTRAPKVPHVKLIKRISRIDRGLASEEEAVDTINRYIAKSLKDIMSLVSRAAEVNQAYISSRTAETMYELLVLADRLTEDLE